MPPGCAERFREIQSARDELVYGAVVRAVVRGASSRYGGQNGGPTQINFKHVNRAMYWLSFVMWCVPLSLSIIERWKLPSNRGVEDQLPSNSGLEDKLPSNSRLQDELPSNMGLEDELPTNRGFEDELAEIAASTIRDNRINFAHGNHGKELTTALADMWAEEKDKAYASAKKGVTGDYYFVFVSTLGASVEDVEMLMPTELVDMKARGRLHVYRSICNGGEYRFTIRIKEKSDFILKRLKEEHGERKRAA